MIISAWIITFSLWIFICIFSIFFFFAYQKTARLSSHQNIKNNVKGTRFVSITNFNSNKTDSNNFSRNISINYYEHWLCDSIQIEKNCLLDEHQYHYYFWFVFRFAYNIVLHIYIKIRFFFLLFAIRSALSLWCFYWIFYFSMLLSLYHTNTLFFHKSMRYCKMVK